MRDGACLESLATSDFVKILKETKVYMYTVPLCLYHLILIYIISLLIKIIKWDCISQNEIAY